MSDSTNAPRPALSLLAPPYRRLVSGPDDIPPSEGDDLPMGTALVWELSRGDWGRAFRAVRSRPGGMALLMVLPPADHLDSVPALMEAAEQCRPHSVLPYHADPAVEDLRVVLRRPPTDLPLEVMDYLSWRGIQVDLDTRRLVRKTVELSAELQTVSGLARALYMSRRALGRRFRKRGLPVPSHVLHFSRILRASISLQTSSQTLFETACDLGYPDGFSLSNQMLRLTGLRPSVVRDHLGWEWIVEAWLRKEAAEGKLDGLTTVVSSPSRSHRSARPLPFPDPATDKPVWRRAGERRARRSGGSR